MRSLRRPVVLGAELMLNSAHRCAAGGQGGSRPGIGRLRGGRFNKVHALINGRGSAVALEITAGQLGYVRAMALFVQV